MLHTVILATIQLLLDSSRSPIHGDSTQQTSFRRQVLIRKYERRDVPAIVRLFYETIHAVNSTDYSEEQLHEWAPEIPDPDIWHLRMAQRCTLVAEDNGQVLAFAELEQDGHLDMFYCHRNAVRRGVGRALFQAIEIKAIEMGVERIFAEVSITARSFFEHCGFLVKMQQSVGRRGIKLTNFVMQKTIS